MQSQQPCNSRCLRTFNDGRQCRMLRKPGHAALCVFHAREEEQILESEKLAAELSSLSGNLNTGLDINHVLGRVFQALAQRRISAREATAFAYIVQLSLQSMPYVKSDIRWATNDAGAYHRMVRQSVPTIRDLPPRHPASSPVVAGPQVGPRVSASNELSSVEAPGFSQGEQDFQSCGTSASKNKKGSFSPQSDAPPSSAAFNSTLSSTHSPAQAFLAARRASSSSAPPPSNPASPQPRSQPAPPPPQPQPSGSTGHIKSPVWQI